MMNDLTELIFTCLALVVAGLFIIAIEVYVSKRFDAPDTVLDLADKTPERHEG